MPVRHVLAMLIALVVMLPPTAIAAVTCADLAATPAATPSVSATGPDAYPDMPESDELRIMAAASLTDAFSEMESILEDRYPDLQITIETAGSRTLVTQLQQGAEADILATADVPTMQAADDAGLIDGAPVPFATNRLIIATPDDNPADIASLDDLANDGTVVVLPGEDVPAGAYARTVICAHAATQDNPDAFLDRIESNIVSEEPDVRHVLTKLLLGEADAGIIYASDAIAAERSGSPLTTIDLPPGITPVPAYPIAPVSGGDTDLARAFIGFVLSNDGQAILAKYGFATAPL